MQFKAIVKLNALYLKLLCSEQIQRNFQSKQGEKLVKRGKIYFSAYFFGEI